MISTEMYDEISLEVDRVICNKYVHCGNCPMCESRFCNVGLNGLTESDFADVRKMLRKQVKA